MNIKVENIRPPLPIRCFDWVAWVDGEEEKGGAFGETKEKAVEALLEKLMDE